MNTLALVVWAVSAGVLVAVESADRIARWWLWRGVGRPAVPARVLARVRRGG